MIVVFWREGRNCSSGSDSNITRWTAFNAKHAEFPADKLSDALKYAEELRAARRNGEMISHVCLQSEMPESVGQAGVSDPSKDYAWSKRRIDPSIPLGRPISGDEITREE